LQRECDNVTDPRGSRDVYLRLAAVGRYGEDADMHVRRMRVVRAAGAIGVVLALGTMGFYVITEEAYSLLECLYMTVITVSTVGFREVIPPRESEALIVFTIFLTMFGVGTGLYFFTAIASTVVEGDLPHRFWRRRMENKIRGLKDHIIVVGAGGSGGQVVRELFHAGAAFVVVEQDPSRIALLTTELHMDFPFVVGDGLEDSTLQTAGIEDARGLVATLHEDRDRRCGALCDAAPRRERQDAIGARRPAAARLNGGDDGSR
jgi:voltage-gated potassium channel